MRVQFRLQLHSGSIGRGAQWVAASALASLVFVAAPSTAHCPAGVPDLPQCACESTGADWPAALDPDQLISASKRSLTAQTSCLRHGGQPYWQIQLLAMSPDEAHDIAHLNPNIATDFRRQAWCSETVAYWHYMALMPFLGGYGNPDWHPSSHVKNVMALRTWYRTEEELRRQGRGGRGRWIGGSELDYANFQAGVNGPCPGAFQALEAFDTTGGHWADSCYHSQVVDSMVIWRIGNPTGPVTAVDVHVIEGNAGGGKFVDVNGDTVGGAKVQNTRWYRNVIDYTRLGSKSTGCGNRRIRGWGIDLHADGTTYCDASRIMTITTPYSIAYPAPMAPDDPDSQTVIFIMNYVMTRPGPIQVTANASGIQTAGALPGRGNHWIVPKGPLGVDPASIQVDLRAEHPLPVEGVVVEWKGGIVPAQYQVMWAGQDGVMRSKTFTLPSGVTPSPNTQQVPIPLAFGPSPSYKVRYLRLSIPASALTRQFEIAGLHFLFDYGTEDDGGGTFDDPVTVGVADAGLPGSRLRLGANRPNPFSGHTVIEYETLAGVSTGLIIYDVAGRRIRSFAALAGGPGTHLLEWDGRDDSGRSVRDGTYFYELRSRDERTVRRMVFLK